eukprot:91908_1
MSICTRTVAESNWKQWENKYKKVSADVALNGISSIAGQERFHFVKLVLYFSFYTFFYVICTFELPGFNKLSLIKLIFYSIVAESLGFGCCSGILGGNIGVNKFPLYWTNIHKNTSKLPTFQSLSKVRGNIDIIIYVIYISLLCYSFISINQDSVDSIHHSFNLLFIFVLLAYYWIFDRIIFLSSRSEYYGQYLLCLYFSNGWYSALQLLQIAVWIWAGVSKLGLWFAYVYPSLPAGSPIANMVFKYFYGKNQKMKKNIFMKKMYKNYPNDLRPSSIAVVNSYFGTMLEIFAGIFMLHPSTRVIGIFCALLLHTFIILNFPMGAVQEWNVCNILFTLYLFVPNGTDSYSMNWNEILYTMDTRLQFILLFTLIFIPLLCNINPDIIDFLIGYRYYCGNWEQGIWIVNKKKWDNNIVPNLVCRNPIYSDNYNNVHKKRQNQHDRGCFGFRIMGTPTGKSTLNILKLLINKYHKNIGYRLNLNDYMIVDESLICLMIYGWAMHWNPNTLNSLKAPLKKTNIDHINKYDIMVIYINSIPTIPLGKKPSFNWTIYDFNHDIIEKGSYTVKEIDDVPHFL